MTEVRTITGEKIGKYELTLVSQGIVEKVFDQIEDRFKDFFAQWTFQEYDIEELRRRLREGEAQLWLVGEDGARLVLVAVTRVLRYPGIKRLSIDIIIGEDLEGCAALMQIGEKWAMQFGCSQIEASCRPGIRKAMEKHGFVKQYEVIVKPISGSTH